jgi:hypothetical protein
LLREPSRRFGNIHAMRREAAFASQVEKQATSTTDVEQESSSGTGPPRASLEKTHMIHRDEFPVSDLEDLQTSRNGR